MVARWQIAEKALEAERVAERLDVAELHLELSRDGVGVLHRPAERLAVTHDPHPPPLLRARRALGANAASVDVPIDRLGQRFVSAVELHIGVREQPVAPAAA